MSGRRGGLGPAAAGKRHEEPHNCLAKQRLTSCLLILLFARHSSGGGSIPLSQMAVDEEDDNAVVSPFSMPRCIKGDQDPASGSLGEKEDKREIGGPTIALAKKRALEPLSFLLTAAACVVKKLGEDCDLAQDLRVIRAKALKCDMDDWLSWCSTSSGEPGEDIDAGVIEGDKSREIATCILVAGLAEALTVGIDDLESESAKETLLGLVNLSEVSQR